MKVLIVEDENRMVSLLRKGFEEEGHTVVCAGDGIEGLELARNHDFDVIILDVMMPKLDGYGLAEILRSEKIPCPILMLTAKDAVEDIVHGLDLGADDYMTKPFSFQELLARVRAIKRRKFSPQATIIHVGDLSLNSATREVSRAGISITLTRTEYGLLEHLVERGGRVVTRERLIESVWGHDRDIEDNTLDAFMRLLRNKVDGDGRSKLIHTIRGVGYAIRSESQ
jgi:DNA-binding response OmpR family regulator